MEELEGTIAASVINRQKRIPKKREEKLRQMEDEKVVKQNKR